MSAVQKFDEGRLAQVLVAPIVSEKATRIAEKHNQVLFKVLRDATKPEIKAAVELMFKVEVESVSDREPEGQDQALRPLHRPPRPRQEGVRVAEAGPGAQLLRGGRVMAVVKVKPTSPGRRAVVKVVHKHLHKGAPEASLLEPQKQKSGRNNNGHITMRHKGGGHKHHYRVVDFRATRTASRRRSSASSTTRTAPPTSRCCATPTASAATSSPRAACRSRAPR
jgi:hypothetical protein